MKILMLVNWKIEYCDQKPIDKQPPDYYVEGEAYWFYRYFQQQPNVDIIDIASFPWLEKIEKNKIRFYIWQTLRALPRIKRYDLVVSHGMQSGVVLSLWRRIFKTKVKHIVFDIGSFNSASEKGFALRLMQFASKSINGVIYHTSSQIDYYHKFFPWLVEKSRFIRFGTDTDFFSGSECQQDVNTDKYIVCVGYSKRDWDTVVRAYQMLDTDVKLRFVGHVETKYNNIQGIEQIPFVSVRELVNQIRQSLFCVLPLEKFNYSYGQMTLMQQMALGKCVVAANVPSLVDYINDGKTAIAYEAKNAGDLAEKLEQMLNNKLYREQVGLQGQCYVQNYCNERIMALEIEQFYGGISNG